jgi:hypothetical protein
VREKLWKTMTFSVKKNS